MSRRTISYATGYTVQELCELGAVSSRNTLTKWLRDHARAGKEYSKPDGRRIRISEEAGQRFLHPRGRKRGKPLPGMVRMSDMWEKYGHPRHTILRLVSSGQLKAIYYRRTTYVWPHEVKERIRAMQRVPLGYIPAFEAAKILGITAKGIRMRMVREGIPIRLWWSVERNSRVIILERDIVMRWALDYASKIKPDQVLVLNLARDEGVSATAIVGWMARNGYEIVLVYDENKKRVRAVSKEAAKAYRSRKNRRGGRKNGA